jgi:site-specific DNA-methyltransferase (adenine-specific)
MKPLSEKTYVDQALANGKGVTWLDSCRVPYENNQDQKIALMKNQGNALLAERRAKLYGGYGEEPRDWQDQKGRFPANLLVSDDILNDGSEHKSSHGGGHSLIEAGSTSCFGVGGVGEQYFDSGSFSRYFDLDAWWNKTVENLPEGMRKTFPFLICPKASKTERDKGLENLEEKRKSHITSQNMENALTGAGNIRNPFHKNFHPTVKPLQLMSYLITLGSKPKDVVLDPFVGSGTTCLASEILNRKWIGIDVSPEYCEIARKRLSTVPEKLETFMEERR